MSESGEFLVVLITAPDLSTAQDLGKTLVEEKIAACVNLVPGLVSIYSWEGAIQEDQEVLLVVKTRSELLESQLIPLVQKHHPYDLPEIIGLPIAAGSQAYLDWIRDETGGIPPALDRESRSGIS